MINQNRASLMEIMEPYWLKKARIELGEKEVDGQGSNPRIIQYHSFTKLGATDDQVPWCSSFVCFIMETNGIPSTQSAQARSWLDWGIPVEKPTLGCVVVLSRGLNNNSGHVGFLVAEVPGSVHILGGNQQNAVCVQAFPKIAVIGYRLPPDEYWSPHAVDPNDTRLS